MKIHVTFNLILSYLLINEVNSHGEGNRKKHNYYRKLFNRPLEKQNPSAHSPPKTDSGGPTFKYPLAFTQRQKFCGGWVRSQSVTDLPIATNISVQLLRLKENGVRELHWCDTEELGYVIKGGARITAVDPDGRGFVGDVIQGDLYTIPRGLGHTIQGLRGGALILVAYNSGAPATFNLGDWLKHIPKEVLAKNFQTSKKTFHNITKSDYYIYDGKPPDPLKKEQKYVAKVTGPFPQSLVYRKEESAPNITRSFGTVRIVDSRNFPATGTAAVIVKLIKGGLRELHWNFVDALIYIIKGKCRMAVFNGHGLARTQDLQQGDIGYLHAYRGNYIENRGDSELKFIEVLPTPNFFHVSLAQSLAHTPVKIVHENTHTNCPFIEGINKDEEYIYGPLDDDCN